MNKKFLESMGNIDEEFIIQAKKPIKRKKYKKRWVAVAAAACFICLIAVNSRVISTLADNIAQLFQLHSDKERIAEVELSVNEKITNLEEKYYASIEDMAKKTGIRILDISEKYKTGNIESKNFWYYPKDGKDNSWLRITADSYFKLPNGKSLFVNMNAYSMIKEPTSADKEILDWAVWDFDVDDVVTYTSSANGLKAYLVIQDTKNPDYKDERDNVVIITYDNIAYFYYFDYQNLDAMKKFVDALVVY